MNSSKEILKKYWGFTSFRPQQEEIVDDVINGHDVLALLPTGGGKSICFQVPGIAREGITLVISPLIALMQDQVQNLRKNGIKAIAITSAMSSREIDIALDNVKFGGFDFLYTSPERIRTPLFIARFKQMNVGLIVVDEAHCISEWGHDFRPEYRKIRKMIEGIGDDIPMIALTATATPKVQSDILKTLKMVEPTIFIDSFNRENLYYEIRPKKNEEATLKNIVGFIRSRDSKSGIIYTINRKTAEKVANLLQVNGINAKPYHAGLDSKLRSATQDDFLMERVDVVVATIAFGMGIDKPDIRFVIHYDLPKSLENYYQDTGRAGRDGLGGDCICYYNYKDVTKLEHLLKDKPVSERQRALQLIDETLAFIESSACRRRFILHYFGEQY